MDLRAYLTQHDGHLTKAGPELARLAEAASCSPSHLYLCALNLKTPGRKLALRLHEASRGRSIDPGALLGLPAPRRKRARRHRVQT